MELFLKDSLIDINFNPVLIDEHCYAGYWVHTSHLGFKMLIIRFFFLIELWFFTRYEVYG